MRNVRVSSDIFGLNVTIVFVFGDTVTIRRSPQCYVVVLITN